MSRKPNAEALVRLKEAVKARLNGVEEATAEAAVVTEEEEDVDN